MLNIDQLKQRTDLENAERAIADSFDNTKIDLLIMEGMVRW